MSLGFSATDAETMKAMLAAVRQPPPPRSPLGVRNAGEQPLAKPPPQLTPRPVPRPRSAPALVAGAPHPFIGTMSTPRLLARSELASTEETPGRADFELTMQLEDDQWWLDHWKRVDQAAGGGGRRKRKAPEERRRPLYPCEMLPDELKDYKKAKAEKKAKEDAAGADEFKAAVADFEASSWVEEDNYVAIVDELQSWVARSGTAATAAGWIRRLMIATKRKKGGGGGEGYTPRDARGLYTRTPPGRA